MASSKRVGFFWGEEKITLIEFEKNTPTKLISSPLGAKNTSPSPFSSNLTEELEINTFFKKMLDGNPIAEKPFYVSLPAKDIILRSFSIPFVKQEEVKNLIKFEAKKYLPIDIQELAYVFYTAPFTEDKVKYLQIIFFAVRKESLARYERIFKQVNAVVSYCEPCMVSLAKFLLFKKEINPTDHLAFLILDKHWGRICFINQGIPQFVREFSLKPHSPSEDINISVESLNLRVVNEIGNSFDFYARQFSGEPIEQVLVSSEDENLELFDALEKELKLKLRKVSLSVNLEGNGQNNDLDIVYAAGACIEPALEELSEFNFLESKNPKFKFKGGWIGFLKSYKDTIFIFFLCVMALVGAHVFFQAQLKAAQQQYDQLTSKQGAFLNVPADAIQAEAQQNIDSLNAYKSIRAKSDMVFILLKVASHLPTGAVLKTLAVKYNPNDFNDEHVVIEMNGTVFKEDTNEEIKVVHQIFSDFKNDKELAQFIKTVAVSLNLEQEDGRQVTGFTIRCS